MKSLIIILTAMAVFSVQSFAAKGERKAAKRAEIRKALRAFDHNRNRQIDGTEIDAVKNAYAAFKRIDANSDGSIGDDEIKALNQRVGDDANAKETKKGKKKREKAG